MISAAVGLGPPLRGVLRDLAEATGALGDIRDGLALHSAEPLT